MLSTLFKMALEKCNELKNNAPLTKKLRFLNSIQSSYGFIFSEMFEHGTNNNIQKININDGNTYNNNIYNMLKSIRNSQTNKTDYIQLERLFAFGNLYCLDTMTEESKKYITKLCDIILDDDYDISKETDKYIITYYRRLKSIPVLYEIISGCYEIIDINQRNNMLVGLNQLITKMNIHSYTLYIDSDLNIENLLSIIQTDVYQPSPNIAELCNYIFNCHKDMIKLKKYNKNKIINNSEEKKTDKLDDNSKEKNTIDNSKEKKTDKLDDNKTKIIDNSKEKKTDNETPKKSKKKKDKIPTAVRKIVWNTYIGKEIITGKCLCCNAEDISSTNFDCGHIKSEKNGGEVNIENLRPICGNCNKSIGGNNMDEFMTKYKIKKPKNWNGIVI